VCVPDAYGTKGSVCVVKKKKDAFWQNTSVQYSVLCVGKEWHSGETHASARNGGKVRGGGRGGTIVVWLARGEYPTKKKKKTSWTNSLFRSYVAVQLDYSLHRQGS